MTNHVKLHPNQQRSNPFSWMHDWAPAEQRDAVAIIDRIANGRDSELVKRRNEEMASSGFSFFRGAAAVMAADLDRYRDQSTRIDTVICGDAHLANFGAYLSPERIPVFDLNDFDEARPGPWEWDVCRFAASIAVAGAKLKPGDSVTPALTEYADTLQAILRGQLVARYYQLERVAEGVSNNGKPRFSNVRAKFVRLCADLHVHTQEETVKDLIENGGHEPMFSSKGEVTPVLDEESDPVTAAYGPYVNTVAAGFQRLLDGYSPKCVAKRPVGEGSLGLRDYLLLIMGQDHKDRLILQIKEATPSALDSALGARPAIHEGERVAQMQKTMQGVSDPLLGWTSIDGQAYYVRQFRDGKASPDPSKLQRDELTEYAKLCGESLARAHARSAEPRILATMGECIESNRPEFVDALAKFAKHYAKVTEEDQRKLDEKLKEQTAAKPIEEIGDGGNDAGDR